MQGFLLLSCVLLLLSGCSDEYVPFPRKYAYPRLSLPTETTYKIFETETCPFSFEYPAFAEISRNSPDSCWVNIRFPQFDGTLHVNSREIGGSGLPLEAHQEEHRRLIYNHAMKAARIIPSPIDFPSGSGVK